MPSKILLLFAWAIILLPAMGLAQSGAGCVPTHDNVVRYLSGMSEEEVHHLVEEANHLRHQDDGSSPSGGDETGDGSISSTGSYSVVITSSGPAKLDVVKKVKDITGLGLKDSKSIVDQAPEGIVKANISEEEANQIKKMLEEVGASVELRH